MVWLDNSEMTSIECMPGRRYGREKMCISRERSYRFDPTHFSQISILIFGLADAIATVGLRQVKGFVGDGNERISRV